ncbi:MAG: N-acetylmuramoyl-L-alanine amidase [Deltaproteobacteria bacterium]|nr:N-acetylmuramoyl-L-alanine amidase [Deltaproteobacteria bacterium]
MPPLGLRLLFATSLLLMATGAATCSKTAMAAEPLIVEGAFEDEVAEELALESVLGALAPDAPPRFVLRRMPDGTLRPLGGLARPEVSRRPFLQHVRPPSMNTKAGVLAGKRIALVAGHGWLEDGAGWRTQRDRWDFSGCGRCRGIIEDFFTAEFVTNQLAPLIENMGGEVVFVREADHSTAAAVTIDEGNAQYKETGAFAAGPNGTRVLASGQQGEARYGLSFAQAGFRRAYARWAGGADRSTTASLVVSSAGGEALRAIDQTQAGNFYRSLGRFWFAASGGSLAWVSSAGVLSADSVKVGGGLHASSGKPWWQMGAKSYVPFAGADSSVTAYGDVSIRPAYAEMLDIDAYVSIHANASGTGPGGTTASGTSVYRYSCQTYADFSLSAGATGCDDPPGSAAFADTMQASIIDGLRAEWDPNWKDRSARVANFGEVRTLVDAPGVLIETAFFDNLEKGTDASAPKYADNRSLHDPRFREALARSIARGIARLYFAGAAAVPERPHGLSAVNAPDGSLRVAWAAVPGATAYRVYRIDGLTADAAQAWDDGAQVSGTEVSLADLQKGSAYAFRVAAVNASGEGYPSAAVVARYRGVKTKGQPANALVVHAYDRRDAWVQDQDNDLTATLAHGGALAALANVYFDGALDDAVPPLDGYALVDVACGKDSSEHDSVAPALITALTAHAAAGRALIVSGEEVAYDLSRGAAADKAFLADVLHVQYVADDAGTKGFAGIAGLSTLGAQTLDDGTHGAYGVTYPDVVDAAAGEVVLRYSDGRGAAVLAGPTFFAGFGLEAIVGGAAREKLFALVVGGFALPPLSPEIVTPPVTPEKPEPEPEVDPEQEAKPAPTAVEPSPTATERAGCACSESARVDTPLWWLAILLLVIRPWPDRLRRRH